MSKNTEPETELVGDVELTVPAKPTKSKTESSPIQISLKQYFDNYANNVHPYTQAFVSANYHGILKTKEEWDSELIGKV